MVIRERPVGLGEQGDDVGAQLLQRLDGDETRDAVAAVHYDLESPCEWRVALYDRFSVRREQIAMRGRRPAGLRDELAVVDQSIQNLNVLAEDGVVREHHLEA